MTVTFRRVAFLYALICFTLALISMSAPQLLLSTWGVESSGPADLVCRRYGAFFAGIGVIFFYARNAEPSFMRTAFIRGFGVSCLILAGLGVMEFANGHAGPGIVFAAVFEVALVLLLPFAVGVGPTPSNGRS